MQFLYQYHLDLESKEIHLENLISTNNSSVISLCEIDFQSIKKFIQFKLIEFFYTIRNEFFFSYCK